MFQGQFDRKDQGQNHQILIKEPKTIWQPQFE